MIGGYDIRKTLRLPFVKNVIHTLASKWVTILIGIIPVMLVTRGLGPIDKGKYSLIISTIGILMQLSTVGLHTSNTYKVSKDRNLLPKLFTNSIFWIVLSASIVSSAFYIFNLVYPSKINMFEGGLVFVVVGTYMSLANIIGQNLNISIDNIRKVNFINIIAKVLTLVLIGYLYLTDNLVIKNAIIVAILEFSVIALLNIWFIRKSFNKIVFKIDWTVLKSTFKYGVRVYAITLMAYLVVRSDIFLVKYFLGNESVGYYSSAVQIIDQIAIFAVVISSLLMPKLTAEKDPKERFRMNKRSFNHLVLIMLAGCITAFILAKYIIIFLFGIEFIEAVSSFRILLFAIFFLSLETSLAQYLASIGLPKELVWAWIATLILNLGLNFYLIPIYQENGAAIASVISYCSIFIFVWYLTYKLSDGYGPS